MIKRNPKQRMSIEQIKAHPWLMKNGDITVLSTPPMPKEKRSRQLPTFQKIDESVEIINDLNKRISDLEEELALYKIK